MKMKLILAIGLLPIMMLQAGECTYSFSKMKNAGAADIVVPIVLSEGEQGFTYEGFAAQDGSDLRIKDTDENLLAHEIDEWEAGGRSIVWVKVPELTEETKLKLSWGDASAPSVKGSPWEGSQVVMHFAGDNPQLSAPADLELKNFNEAQSEVEGIVGGARKFHGVPTLPRLHASALKLSTEVINNFTISFWWKADVIGGENQYLFQLFSNAVSKEFTVYVSKGKNLCLYSQAYSGDTFSGSIPISDEFWHHYAFVKNGTTIKFYKDGFLATEVQQTQATTISNGADETWKMTFGSSKTPGAPASGTMDEFRFDLVARSDDYIRSECELQSLSSDRSEITVAYPDCGIAAESPLADFPVFVPIRGVDYGVGDFDLFVESINSGKISVSSAADSTSYPYEVEYAYGDGVDAVGLWVKVPSFSKDTVLKVCPIANYYIPNVNVGGETQDDKVWNAQEYVFVNHILPIGGRTDSAHGINFRPYTTKDTGAKRDWSVYSPAVNGPSGPYAAMNCSTTTVAHADNVTVEGMALTNVFTLSWWMRQDNYATVTRDDGPQYIMFIDGDPQRTLMVGGSVGEHTIYLSAKSVHSGSGITVPDGGWHHYAYVSDGTELRKYVDGTELQAKTTAYDFNFLSFSYKRVCLGNSAKGAQFGVAGLRGGIDEFRCEAVARSAEWISAMYKTGRAYIDGVGYGYAPEFADTITAVEEDSKIKFSSYLSCRTSANVYFCYGASDGGDQRDDWEHTIPIEFGEKSSSTVSASVEAVGDIALYGRFFVENNRGKDMTRTVLARKDRLGKSYCPVTIAYSGEETLENFPVAITFPSSVRLPSLSSSLRILDADGRSLPFEVETWNPAGTSVIWVRLDRLDADKTLQATWQSGVNIEAWPKAEVWKNNYKCAYHFDENGAAKTGLAADDFNDFADGFTVSVWADVGSCATKKLAAFSASSYSFDINYTAEEQNVISLGLTGFYLTPKSGSAGNFSADLGAAAFAELSAMYRGETLGVHHYVWVSDGYWFKKYRDGELMESMFLPLTLGSGIPGVRRMTASFANGSLAEVHVANKARSAAWIAAEYANKAGGMVTLGEVTRPGLTVSVK